MAHVLREVDVKQSFGKIGARTKRSAQATPGQGVSEKAVEDALAELRKTAREPGYRERSLALHGTICARCGKEFSGADLRLLTVHHKDNNPTNNPPDGSNWENLCVYCHDMEHSRELLADYEDGRGSARDNSRRVYVATPSPEEGKNAGLGTLADLFAKAKRN